MFDSEHPIVGSLLKELDVGKKSIARELIKKAPRPPGVDFAIRKRLEKSKARPETKDDNDNFNLMPPPSPSRPPSLGPHLRDRMRTSTRTSIFFTTIRKIFRTISTTCSTT